MRVERIALQRFKRFREYSMDFKHQPGLPDVFLLVGDNGTGKSTLLQAIAATLGTATSQIRNPQELDWPGFELDGLSAGHRGFAEVQLTVSFAEDELKATRDYFNLSDYATLDNTATPGDYPQVDLVWTTSPKAERPVSALKGASGYFQFQGRRYAYNLIHNRNAPKDMFEHIGGVFWYTEQRTSHSLSPFYTEGSQKNDKAPVQQIDDEAKMRNLFTKWFALDGDKKSGKLGQFNEYYGRLFPGRRLSRLADSYGAAESPIYFDDGNHEYEVSELSGGERALMPMLLDFVEWGINNSVILIDELELHLHPPLQQALITLLPELGHNNQFIVTTHSDAVASLVPREAILYVEEATLT